MDHSHEIKQFIVNEFIPDVQVDQLDADYDLLASGVIDSLGLLRVIGWLETHFDIPIDDIEIAEKDFISVTAISQFVDRESRLRVSVSETANER